MQFNAQLIVVFLLQLVGNLRAFPTYMEPVMFEWDRPRNAFIEPLLNGTKFFSSRILQDLSNGTTANRNVFFSPLGLFNLLAVVRLASGGQTRLELNKLPLFDGANDSVDAQFRRLRKSLLSADKRDTADFSLATRLFLDQSIQIKPSFVWAALYDHSTFINRSDFAKRHQQVRHKINSWIANQTRGLAKTFLSEEDITRFTKMVLINALYFNGQWHNGFAAERTTTGDFNLADKTVVQVPMMKQEGAYRHHVSCGALDNKDKTPDILEVPFKVDPGNRMKYKNMVIMMANEQISLQQIQQDFAKKVDEWRSQTRLGKVNLSLPKFSMEYQVDIIEALEKQGIDTTFLKGSANFSKLTSNINIALSKVIQKASVTFTETGMTAMAVSSAIGILRSMPPKEQNFDVNRPFIFFVEDHYTGAMLFMGRVDDPR